jgi:hypothetical protein
MLRPPAMHPCSASNSYTSSKHAKVPLALTCMSYDTATKRHAAATTGSSRECGCLLVDKPIE